MLDAQLAAAPSKVHDRQWIGVAPAVFAAAWGGNHFTPLLVLYKQLDHFSATQVYLLLAAYIVGLVPGFLATRRLSQWFGRASVMITALVLGIAGSLVLASNETSFVLMALGRALSGLSVSAALTVGTLWIRELSAARLPAIGAVRASMAITLGLGVGAAITGVLATWFAQPTVLPYLVHVGVSVIAVVPLVRAPSVPAVSITDVVARESPRPHGGSFWPGALVASPWVFGVAAIAYALTPALVRISPERVEPAYAALLAVVTLAVGTAVQPLVPLIGRVTRAPAAAGLALGVVGVILCAVTASTGNLFLGILTACVLGCSFGVSLVAGLVKAQALSSGGRDLVGRYYALTYVGFTFPAIIAAAAPSLSYPGILLIVAGMASVCALVVLHQERSARR